MKKVMSFLVIIAMMIIAGNVVNAKNSDSSPPAKQTLVAAVDEIQPLGIMAMVSESSDAAQPVIQATIVEGLYAKENVSIAELQTTTTMLSTVVSNIMMNTNGNDAVAYNLRDGSGCHILKELITSANSANVTGKMLTENSILIMLVSYKSSTEFRIVA